MRRLVIALLAASAIATPVAARAFANTNSGGKLYVCATPQQTDLSQAGYEALAWVQVTGLGSHGQTGPSTNILTYNTWDTTVIQKAKGVTDAGSPVIELSRNPSDPGQIIMRQIAPLNFNYAFKLVKNDGAFPGGTGTIIYNRGLVTGPTQPNGRNEDFDLEMFTLGLNQLPIVVPPAAAGNAPVLTVAPAVTGTAKVANVLTTTNGTFTGDATITYTYTWKAGGTIAAGTNGNPTYLPVTADIGKVVTCVVRATNSAGSAEGTSAPTTAVVA